MISPTDANTIRAFGALYGGGLAQKLRDSGVPDAQAMPPWTQVSWLGKQVAKCPLDLWVYQEIICETKPELIVETGTSGAGSAWFFATLYDMLGIPGHIITVDKDCYPHLWLPHPRITYLTGDSVGEVVAAQMAVAARGKRTMVSLDSLHTYAHVAREMALYSPLVTPGCYMVVEDTGCGPTEPGRVYTDADQWCDRAVVEFAAAHPEFEVDLAREKHLLTSNHRGWMRRR